MKKLFISLFFALLIFGASAQKGYRITRYEVKSDALFVCLNSTRAPVYIEKFLTIEERKDSITIKAAIEQLIAELQVKELDYIAPEQFVSKPKTATRIEGKTDSVRVKNIRNKILVRRQAVKDSIARVMIQK